MKMARIIFSICVAICVDFAASSSKEEFLRWDAAYSKALCDNGNFELIKEVIECNKQFIRDVNTKYVKCEDDAYPENKNYPGSTLKRMCDNPSVAKKYNDCMDEYYSNEDFRTQVINSKEANKCALEAMKNYDAYTDELILREE